MDKIFCGVLLSYRNESRIQNIIVGTLEKVKYILRSGPIIKLLTLIYFTFVCKYTCLTIQIAHPSKFKMCPILSQVNFYIIQHAAALFVQIKDKILKLKLNNN